MARPEKPEPPPGFVRGLAGELREGQRHEAESDRVSYRPVRVIGLLLILESLALSLVGFSRAARLGWQPLLPGAPMVAFEEAVFLTFFGPAAALALVAGLAFLLLRRRGWFLAALSQSLSLGGCLWLYSQSNPPFVYPVMLYCVVVIAYLNTRDVRLLFAPRRADKEAG